VACLGIGNQAAYLSLIIIWNQLIMDTNILQRFHHNLVAQRENLKDWLFKTPNEKKQVCLGPLNEQDVQVHLHTLDEAIERAEDHTLGFCEVCQDYIEPALLEMDYTCCVCLEHLSAT
jgi:RNA polymerase-binding transcription factor DksA